MLNQDVRIHLALLHGHPFQLTVAGQRFPYAAILEQRFQLVEGVARAGNRRELLHDVKLRG